MCLRLNIQLLSFKKRWSASNFLKVLLNYIFFLNILQIILARYDKIYDCKIFCKLLKIIETCLIIYITVQHEC